MAAGARSDGVFARASTLNWITSGNHPYGLSRGRALFAGRRAVYDDALERGAGGGAGTVARGFARPGGTWRDIVVSALRLRPPQRLRCVRCAGPDSRLLRKIPGKELCRRRRPQEGEISVVPAGLIGAFPCQTVDARPSAQARRRADHYSPRCFGPGGAVSA